ncbi:MAG: leucine-rich repeat domain-containing protein [Lachnospiraceae bacterium]|nr:leucine-rich repeat domain-containing protein [Lachnospiraceae bacterium]
MTRTTGSGIARKMMAFLLCVVLAAGNMSVPVLASGETAVPEESLVEVPAGDESVPGEESSEVVPEETVEEDSEAVSEETEKESLEVVPEETVEANSEAVSEENVEAADPAEEVGEGEAAEYHITVAEGIANGTVTVSTETAASGETITVTCTPSKEPFKLYYLRLNGQDVVCENGTYEFVMPAEDVEITAAFVPGGSCGEDMTWQLIDGHLTINGTGEMTSAPWEKAGLYEQITSVEISEGITSIAPYAFERARMTSAVIPDSVVSIGHAAFEWCGSLEEVTLSKNLERIERDAFYDCSSLKKVTMFDKVTHLGEGAFHRCSELESITLSSSLETIDQYAFEFDSKLKTVDLSGAPVKLECGAFKSCPILEEVKGTENIRSIGRNAFYEDTMLQRFAVSDYVTEIGPYAFYYCTGLEEVNFGNSLEKIEEYAFYGCRVLRSIELPEGVTTVGRYAFNSCYAVEHLSLPDSITSLGRGAFGIINGLQEVRVPRGITFLSDLEFSDAVNAEIVYIPASVKIIEVASNANGSTTFSHYPSTTDVYFYGDDFAGYKFLTTDFKGTENTVLHILQRIDPATLTAETGGAIYNWYQANQNSVINDLEPEEAYRIEAVVSRGGSVTVQPNALRGVEVLIRVSPLEGYHLKAVTVNDGDVTVEERGDGRYAFTMPGCDVLVKTDFEPDEGYYEIIAYEDEECRITSNLLAAKERETVTITSQVADGFELLGVYANNGEISLMDNNDGTWSFTMPAENVTLTGEFQPIWDHVNEGKTTVWLIKDGTGWEKLKTYVESGRNTSGMNFRLTSDITTSSMIGSNGQRFKGSFDGAGHTLTVNYSDDRQSEAAPFQQAENASFKNLHTAGRIETSGKFMSGLVGRAHGRLTVTNCRSSVTLISRVTGDGTHGGFVGVGSDYSNITMQGCLFDGEMLGEETNSCGGFIGWQDRNHYAGEGLAISDSVFAPSRVTISTEGCMSFLRNPYNIYIDCCYYTEEFGTANENTVRVYEISADDGIEISLNENKIIAEYDVGNLKFTEGAVQAGEKIFGIPDKSACLNFTYSGSEDVTGIAAVPGETTETEEGFVVAMPAEDVRIVAAYPVSVSTDGHGTVIPDRASFPGGAVFTDNLAPDRASFPVGAVVTLTVAADPLYKPAAISMNGDALTENEDGTYSFVMPAGKAAVTAEFVPILPQEEDTEDTVWLIKSTEDWDALAAYVKNGGSTAGARVRLAADITVTTMIERFEGTFNGDGHTLTVNYDLYDGEMAAPFLTAESAVFENLIVGGVISNVGDTPMAGLVGTAQGTTRVTNCRSTVQLIADEGSGEYTPLHSMFIYRVAEGATVEVTGCVSHGIHNADKNKSGLKHILFSGFIGKNEGTANLKDCVFVPASYSGHVMNSSIFVSGGQKTLENCYYTYFIGGGAGADQIYKVRAGENVVLELNDGAVRSEYGVSGLAFYGNSLTFDGQIYCAREGQVGLMLDTEEGTGAVFSANYGTISGENGTYILTMGSADAVISAAFPIRIDTNAFVGTVEADKETAKPGETVTLTVESYEGYIAAKIYVNGEAITPVDGVYRFTMPAGQANVIARSAQGKCGDDLYYWLVADQLTIFGTGDMYHYVDSGEQPGWSDMKNRIGSVLIENGATGIGDGAFEDLLNLRRVSIPESVTAIGMRAFNGCMSLTEVTIPAGVSTIGLNAFHDCIEVTDVYIMGTDYSGWAFETAQEVNDFGTPEGTVLHLPKNVNPAELTEEKDRSVYYWYLEYPESVVNDQADTREPAFKTSSLVLSGRIGVRLYMELPPVEGIDYEGSYMEFTVAGKDGATTKVPYSEAVLSTASGYYGFTCYVSSIQMADEITAVYHYTRDGEEKTLETSYTVEEYIDQYAEYAAQDPDKYGAALPLVQALGTYGFYEQIFLAAQRGWSLGADHAKMARSFKPDGYTAEEAEAAAAALSGMDASLTLNKDIASVNASLLLDSDTSICLYITRADSYTKGITATVDGKEVTVQKLSGGRYRVTIPNIGANRLGKKYEVKLRTESDTEEATLTISAMSYVKACLGKENLEEDERNAMMALYEYYVRAKEYIGG